MTWPVITNTNQHLTCLDHCLDHSNSIPDAWCKAAFRCDWGNGKNLAALHSVGTLSFNRYPIFEQHVHIWMNEFVTKFYHCVIPKKINTLISSPAHIFICMCTRMRVCVCVSSQTSPSLCHRPASRLYFEGLTSRMSLAYRFLLDAKPAVDGYRCVSSPPPPLRSRREKST